MWESLLHMRRLPSDTQQFEDAMLELGAGRYDDFARLLGSGKLSASLLPLSDVVAAYEHAEDDRRRLRLRDNIPFRILRNVFLSNFFAPLTYPWIEWWLSCPEGTTLLSKGYFVGHVSWLWLRLLVVFQLLTVVSLILYTASEPEKRPPLVDVLFPTIVTLAWSITDALHLFLYAGQSGTIERYHEIGKQSKKLAYMKVVDDAVYFGPKEEKTLLDIVRLKFELSMDSEYLEL